MFERIKDIGRYAVDRTSDIVITAYSTVRPAKRRQITYKTPNIVRTLEQRNEELKEDLQRDMDTIDRIVNQDSNNPLIIIMAKEGQRKDVEYRKVDDIFYMFKRSPEEVSHDTLKILIEALDESEEIEKEIQRQDEEETKN